jgi:hypothetical protein
MTGWSSGNVRDPTLVRHSVGGGVEERSNILGLIYELAGPARSFPHHPSTLDS